MWHGKRSESKYRALQTSLNRFPIPLHRRNVASRLMWGPDETLEVEHVVDLPASIHTIDTIASRHIEPWTPINFISFQCHIRVDAKIQECTNLTYLTQILDRVCAQVRSIERRAATWKSSGGNVLWNTWQGIITLRSATDRSEVYRGLPDTVRLLPECRWSWRLGKLRFFEDGLKDEIVGSPFSGAIRWNWWK